jgi:hypothetical protein
MQENTKRWLEITALAAIEQDPRKFSKLVLEIEFLMNWKRDGLWFPCYPPSLEIQNLDRIKN